MEKQKRAQETKNAQSQPDKKIKITFEEYSRISILIVGAIKERERQGEEAVTQSEIINDIVKQLEVDDGAGTSMDKALETSKKVANCIQHLITKENVLMVTQESKVKNDRMLCMNINVDMSQMNLGGGKVVE
jgi:hypothetical protein